MSFFIKFYFYSFIKTIFFMENKLIIKPSALFTNIAILNKKGLLLLLFGICIVAFFPTFFNDFQLAWDDTWQLLENPLAQDTSLQYLLYHFTHFWQQQYSPVNSFFYSLIVQLFGFNPAAFHSACLLIHLVNNLLIFEIIRKLVFKLLPYK